MDRNLPVYEKAISWSVAGVCWQCDSGLGTFKWWIAKPKQSSRLRNGCLKLKWVFELLYIVVLLLTYCSDQSSRKWIKSLSSRNALTAVYVDYSTVCGRKNYLLYTRNRRVIVLERFNFGEKNNRKNPLNFLASYPQSFLSSSYGILLKNSWRMLFTFSKSNLSCLRHGHLSNLVPPPVYFSSSNDSAISEIENTIFPWLNVKR